MRLFWYSSCSSMKLYFKYTCCLFIVRSTWRLNSFTLQFHAFLQVLKFLYHISKNLWYLDFQSDSNEGSQVKKAYDSLDRLHDDGIWYSKCLLCLFFIQSWNWSPLMWGQVLFSSFIQFTWYIEYMFCFWNCLQSDYIMPVIWYTYCTENDEIFIL